MATTIPEEQLQFSQLAVRQGWIQPEQARAAMELMRRYQNRGGDVPSIARILVNKGWLGRKQGEMILRHIFKGESLPSPVPPAARFRRCTASSTSIDSGRRAKGLRRRSRKPPAHAERRRCPAERPSFR